MAWQLLFCGATTASEVGAELPGWLLVMHDNEEIIDQIFRYSAVLETRLRCFRPLFIVAKNMGLYCAHTVESGRRLLCTTELLVRFVRWRRVGVPLKDWGDIFTS